MSLSIRRTFIQIEFANDDEGRSLARAFVESCRNAGLTGKAHLSGVDKTKVKMARPGRFGLDDLERAIANAISGDLLARAVSVRIQFRIR